MALGSRLSAVSHADDPPAQRRADVLGSDDDVDALAPSLFRAPPPARGASAAAAACSKELAGWSEDSKAKLVALFETVRCPALLLRAELMHDRMPGCRHCNDTLSAQLSSCSGQLSCSTLACQRRMHTSGRASAKSNQSLVLSLPDRDHCSAFDSHAHACMQVNGIRSCKTMLLHEWNLDCLSNETLRATKVPKILQALGLKSGVMTARQVRSQLSTGRRCGLQKSNQPDVGAVSVALQLDHGEC